MKRFGQLIAATAIAAVPGVGSAQFDMGGPPQFTSATSKPWTEFNLNPKTKVKLAFRNASITSVLQFYQKISKITIVKDPGLDATIDLSSATEVSLSKSFQILASTLDLMGYTMVKSDDLLLIKKKTTQAQRPQGGPPGAGMGGPGGPGGGQQNSLKVYQITYASATEIARVLNEVFTTQQQVGTGGGGGFPGFGGPGGNGGGGPGGGLGGQGAPPNEGQATAPGQGQRGAAATTPIAKASAETFTNSVLVYGSASIQNQVESLLKNLDRPADVVLQSRYFKLSYADAASVATSMQSLLTANATTGRGSTSSTTSTQNRGGFPPFFGGGSSTTNSGGTVTADTRMNAILVTTTAGNMELVEKLLPEVDQPVQITTTTFVFPLANARATDVAALLTSAYGQRSGTTGTRATTSTSSTRTTTSSTQNRNSGTGGLGGSVQPSGVNVSLADPMANAGELQTNISAQGFGGGGGFQFGGGGGNNQRSTTGTTEVTRDANGKVVNTQDLTNQVTAIADPNTNSVIIVTSPENAEMIRQVLDQLDKIPEQVMIETVIVEASLDATSKLGVEWNWAMNKALGISGATGTAATNFGLSSTGQGFGYTLSTSNFDGLLNLLQQDQKFHVLSTPRIFTSNNVQAEINISQSVPYIVSSRENTDGSYTYNYSFEDVGIVLTVTPHITANGIVTMDVAQTANELAGYTDFNAPIVNQREATTTVSVEDGHTIILGGIIRNTVSSTVKKLPILGDLPILGNLFKSTTKEDQKTELLVFLRPRVVRNSDDAQKLSDEAKKNMGADVRKGMEGLNKEEGNGSKN